MISQIPFVNPMQFSSKTKRRYYKVLKKKQCDSQGQISRSHFERKEEQKKAKKEKERKKKDRKMTGKTQTTESGG